MKKWQKTVEKIATELDWNFEVSDGTICLQIYSPAGQDFNLEIDDASSFEEYRRIVEQNYENFDPEEEALLWYGQHNGEPSSLRALLDDMDWCDNKLKELSYKLEEYARKKIQQ